MQVNSVVFTMSLKTKGQGLVGQIAHRAASVLALVLGVSIEPQATAMTRLVG
jgi:hypothetical protein